MELDRSTHAAHSLTIRNRVRELFQPAAAPPANPGELGQVAVANFRGGWLRAFGRTSASGRNGGKVVVGSMNDYFGGFFAE